MKCHPLTRFAATVFSIIMLLLGVASWAVSVHLFLNARLLHLPHFYFIVISIIIFVFVIVIVPILVLINGISKNVCKKLWFCILICVETILTAILVLLCFWVAPTDNKIAYAKPLTLELISQKIESNTQGMYFFSTWEETGTFGPEELFFAQWIDFPLQYDVKDDIYYFHANKEATASTDLMKKLKDFLLICKIEKLPAVIIINSKQEMFCFENITYNSIQTATDESTLKFKQYLSHNYNTK